MSASRRGLTIAAAVVAIGLGLVAAGLLLGFLIWTGSGAVGDAVGDVFRFLVGGVTYLLPLAVGHQRAMELLLLGERQSAERLASLGLVNGVVPRAELLETAVAWASEIAERNPWSVARLKRLVTEELQGQLVRAMELETAATVEAFRRPEARTAADAFRDRR